MRRLLAILVFIAFCWSVYHTFTLPAFETHNDFDGWLQQYSNAGYKANCQQVALWTLIEVALFVLLCLLEPAVFPLAVGIILVIFASATFATVWNKIFHGKGKRT
jgi:hypothetical protein